MAKYLDVKLSLERTLAYDSSHPMTELARNALRELLVTNMLFAQHNLEGLEGSDFYNAVTDVAALIIDGRNRDSFIKVVRDIRYNDGIPEDYTKAVGKLSEKLSNETVNYLYRRLGDFPENPRVMAVMLLPMVYANSAIGVMSGEEPDILGADYIRYIRIAKESKREDLIPNCVGDLYNFVLENKFESAWTLGGINDKEIIAWLSRHFEPFGVNLEAVLESGIRF